MDSFTEVFSWGSDQAGQLGLGGTIGKTFPTPRLCSFNVLIKELSCGEEHSAFISNQGHLYTMGSNTEGRLGIEDASVTFSSSPCLVSKLSDKNPIKLACGWGHTAVITESGEVWSWGVGEFGALGLNSTTSHWSPHKLLLPDNFLPLQVSCGSRHTAILSKTGTLAMAGCGKAGQLGTHKREQENSPVLIDTKNIIQVACGIFHTLILNSKGQVFAAGGNSFGQLGLGSKKSSSCFECIKSLDGVYLLKIAAGYHSAAVSDNGELYIWGSGTFGEFLAPHKLHFSDRVKEVSIGGTFTVVYLQDRNIYSWGNNTNGELGVNDYEPRTTPTMISSLKGKKINSLACGGNFCIALGNNVLGRNRPQGHVRSQSKVEKKSEFSFKRKNEEVKKEEFSFKRKNEELKKEEKAVNEDRLRIDRLRFDLDETTSQNVRLKNRTASMESGFRFVESENVKLKEENQQLLIRLKEMQSQLADVKGFREEFQSQTRAQELKLIRDENFLLQNRVQELLNQVKEISKIKEETQNYSKELKMLKEENFRLNKDLSRTQDDSHQLQDSLSKDLNFLKDENFLLSRFKEETHQLQIRLQESSKDSKTLKDETHQLQIRLQECSKDSKTIKDENISLKRKIEELHLDCDLLKKNLIDEKNKFKTFELNYQLLTEENSKLLKQSETLFSELTRVQKENEHIKLYEKENLYSKDAEIERLSQSYHDLRIQLTRLAEENKIFRSTNSDLEEKNRKLFENLEKELATRAHEYKQRTLNILSSDSHKQSVSPIRNVSVSPSRNKTELLSRTKLSEVTQAKIGNTAARLLAQMENESALANIRISSPSRRSPERPVPYKTGVSKEIREILRSKLQEYRE